MEGGEDTNISLSPHTLYLVLLTLYAGRLSLNFKDIEDPAFDQWIAALHDLFSAKFPKTGEFIKLVKETIGQSL